MTLAELAEACRARYAAGEGYATAAWPTYRDAVRLGYRGGQAEWMAVVAGRAPLEEEAHAPEDE